MTRLPVEGLCTQDLAGSSELYLLDQASQHNNPLHIVQCRLLSLKAENPTGFSECQIVHSALSFYQTSYGKLPSRTGWNFL